MRVLSDPAERPAGPHAIALPGDVLLANEKAAFVITQPGEPRTYYYYGGVLVDAVAVSGCAQAAPERFGEFAPLAGRLDITNFPASVLRGLPHGFIPIKRATPRFLTNPIFVDVDGGGYTAPGGKTCTYTAPR